jgi:hypothetical protein
VKLHPGYALATIGYMVAISVVVTAPVDGSRWPAWLQLPLFTGLGACALLALADGQWQRRVPWWAYLAVVAVTGGYALAGEWYARGAGPGTRLGDLLVSTAGVIALLVLHRTGRREGVL